VNDDLVGVVNGSLLYVVNRFNGKVLWKAQTDGAPGAGAALSQLRAYVPMVDGLVASYRLKTMKDPQAELMKLREDELSEEQKEQLEEERRETIRLQQEYIPPLLCRSWGRISVPPVVTIQTEGEELVAWPTDRGFIFVGAINRLEEEFFTIRYRLETGAEIAAAPTYRPPNPDDPGDHGTLYATSRDGFVHALMANDGDPLWRFSAGEPLVEPPVYLRGRVFAAVQLGGLHCLDAVTGSEQWWAPNIMQFVALSNNRVYAVDNLERLVVLNVETGARLDAIPIYGHDVRLINTETDRIYLASRKGLIQCLHEVELSQPIQHRLPPVPAKVEEAAAEEEKPAKPQPEQPAGPEGDPFRGADDPFKAGPADAGPQDAVPNKAGPGPDDGGGDPFNAPQGQDPFGNP
jgi:outer membrane protein assembly factor BamB